MLNPRRAFVLAATFIGSVLISCSPQQEEGVGGSVELSPWPVVKRTIPPKYERDFTNCVEEEFEKTLPNLRVVGVRRWFHSAHYLEEEDAFYMEAPVYDGDEPEGMIILEFSRQAGRAFIEVSEYSGSPTYFVSPDLMQTVQEDLRGSETLGSYALYSFLGRPDSWGEGDFEPDPFELISGVINCGGPKSP